MNNKIVIKNREPQQITINGGGEVIGITTVLVNGIDVTEGSVAYVIVPTKTSELINDSGFITQETDPTIPYYIKQITQGDINTWNNKQEQLVSGVNIKTVNDNSLLGSGNIDISTSYTAGYGININASNEISNTITSYNDLTDLPTIPTSTNDLINDSDFVTSNELSDVAFSGSYADLSNIPEIPDSTSDLINDSGFIDMNLLWGLFPKSTGSGASINLTDTVKNTPLYLSLGATQLSQDGTPTPSSPQDIHTITGSNTIKIEGSNLTIKNVKGYFNTQATAINVDNGSESFVFYAVEGQKYTYSCQETLNRNIIAKVGTLNIVNGTPITNIRTLGQSQTFTSEFTGYCILYVNSTKNEDIKNSFMINVGETALPYTPYVSQEADIDLGDIEYCKIGTYADEFIRSNDGTWQLEKNIGKVVLDTLTFETATSNTTGYVRFKTTGLASTIAKVSSSSETLPMKSNCYIAGSGDNSYARTQCISAVSSGNIFIYDTDYSQDTLTNFMTHLTTTGAYLYYPLATPTYTQITGTLAEQLETIYKELTPETEQTNISQTNEDLPFTISATTLKSLSSL